MPVARPVGAFQARSASRPRSGSLCWVASSMSAPTISRDRRRPGQSMPDGSSTPLCSKTCLGAVRYRRLSSRSRPGFPCSRLRQSAASQSVSRSMARSRIRGEGGISGLGGCKIGSLRGLVQAGNAGPRSP